MSGASSSELLKKAEPHLRRGEWEQAIALLQASLAIDSAQPDAWFNLAWAQRAVRSFDDALGSYQEAIDRGVSHPEEAYVNRAAILSDHLFNPQRAIAELEAASLANPSFVPALLNLGNLYEDLGVPDLARAAYGRALEVHPGNGRAHARIAMIDLAVGASAGVVDRLRKAIDQTTTLEDRAELLFALGTALDGAAAYDDAFQAFEAANWIARSIAPQRYDPIAQEALVDRLIAAYPADRPVAVAGSPVQAPIFICGMFRSGSTLLEQILGRHSAVHCGGELEALPALARSLRPYPEAAAALSAEQVVALRADYLKLAPATGILTDKRCDNFLHIGLIKTLFPESKIVHTRRNALDTFLSVYFLHFGEGVTYGNDLSEILHFYRQYLRLMAHWRKVFSNDIIDFDYDHLVAEPDKAIFDLIGELGLPWEDGCLVAGSEANVVRTASAWQVRAPVHRRSSGRWQRYRHRLEGVVAALAEMQEDVASRSTIS
ncbi:tetratricopeptide repeat-containing sulfotransferase family protein [Sphingomonas sp. MMS24-J45]|uniref:tetratricopeptide repeat-containing sulfotransferase family protein n=1 Tax=Sphingomonas sp. MMS24-J45 TaxID=3238806 RepID=UPI0038501397